MAALRTIVVGLMTTLVFLSPIVSSESAVELDSIIHLSENDLAIKGIAENPEEDKILMKNLKSDPKERAENIMIVDLMRNDLSKIAQKNLIVPTRK